MESRAPFVASSWNAGQVSRHLDDVHPQLVVTARTVVSELSAFAPRLDRYDGVDHEQHRVYLGRADRLAGHLRVALSAADDAESASALALTRSALEHHAQDLILHRGTRYVRTQQITDDDAWAAIEAAYEVQDARWARSLAEPPTRSKKGVVTYVFRGIADAEADPATTTDLLHPIYFEMDRYQPTTGRPADQANFDDGIIDDEHRRHFAVENQARWHQWISWAAQRKSLELNRIFVGRDLVAVDVHYAFLSGFTHATNAAYDAALGRWGTLSDRGMSELAAELVYLYVAWLGAAELRLLTTMEDRQPPVRITGRSEIDELASSAEAASAHLWPPGGVPHNYDRVQEINRLAFRSRRETGQRPEPVPVDDDSILYYADPLDRLRRLHTSFSEMMTGVSYQAPWPNPTHRFW